MLHDGQNIDRDINATGIAIIIAMSIKIGLFFFISSDSAIKFYPSKPKPSQETKMLKIK